MAFCKYCGKELSEGEVCNCQGAQAAAQAVPEAAAAQTAAAQAAPEAAAAQTAAAQAAPEAAAAQTAAAQAASEAQAAAAPAPKTPSVDTEKLASTAKTVGGMYLKMWKSPADAAKELIVCTDKIAMICLIAVQALASSIFALCAAGKLGSVIGSLLGSVSYLFGSSYKISGLKAFFLTLLFSLLFAALWGLLFWLAGLITKTKLGLNQVLAVTAARAVIVAPLMIVSGILLLIIPALGLVISFFSVLFVICVVMEMLRSLEGMTANKCIYATFATTLLFSLLFVWIGASLLTLYV